MPKPLAEEHYRRPGLPNADIANPTSLQFCGGPIDHQVSFFGRTISLSAIWDIAHRGEVIFESNSPEPPEAVPGPNNTAVVPTAQESAPVKGAEETEKAPVPQVTASAPRTDQTAVASMPQATAPTAEVDQATTAPTPQDTAPSLFEDQRQVNPAQKSCHSQGQDASGRASLGSQKQSASDLNLFGSQRRRASRQRLLSSPPRQSLLGSPLRQSLFDSEAQDFDTLQGPGTQGLAQTVGLSRLTTTSFNTHEKVVNSGEPSSPDREREPETTSSTNNGFSLQLRRSVKPALKALVDMGYLHEPDAGCMWLLDAQDRPSFFGMVDYDEFDAMDDAAKAGLKKKLQSKAKSSIAPASGSSSPVSFIYPANGLLDKTLAESILSKLNDMDQLSHVECQRIYDLLISIAEEETALQNTGQVAKAIWDSLTETTLDIKILCFGLDEKRAVPGLCFLASHDGPDALLSIISRCHGIDASSPEGVGPFPLGLRARLRRTSQQVFTNYFCPSSIVYIIVVMI